MKYLNIIVLIMLVMSCNQQYENIEKRSGIMNEQIGNRNKNTIRKFFQLLSEENIEDFISLFSETGKQVNPYASGLFPEGAKGRKELLAYWKPIPGYFDGMEFPIEELYAMEDPNIIYVKYQGKIVLKGGAGIYENQYYSTFIMALLQRKKGHE